MKIAILGKIDTWYTNALQTAFRLRNIEVPCYPVTTLTASAGTDRHMSSSGYLLDNYEVLLVRAIPSGSLEQITYRMDALHRLENLGVRVINSAETIERGVDKYYTLSLMEDLGIKVPPTIVTEKFDDALAAFDELGKDVVVKPLFGSEGRGMVRVTDKDAAYRLFRALEMGRYVFYIQKYIPHDNRDFRILVIGDRVMASMTRTGKDWKCNMANGAGAKALEADDELIDISIRSAEILKADYAGVDILPGEDGKLYLIELNTIPGWRGLKKATGFDAAEHLVDYILEKTV